MKTKLFPVIGISVLAGLVPAGTASAKPPVKKPAAAKPAGTIKAAAEPNAKTGPIVLGTKQLPGDFGQLGQTYTVGRLNPINVTLRGAEYTTTRFNVAENVTIPSCEQKLLVLHYTIQNPTPSEQRFYWGSLRFTAVDSKDVNHEDIQAITREGTNDPVDLSLKPAQKLDVQSAILVPANGVMPKLILLREDGDPVVRYDLRGKVKPIAAPFADPADPTGATSLKVTPAQMGMYYTCGAFDIKVDSAAYTHAPLGVGESAAAPEDGKRYIALVFSFRNRTNREERYYWATFAPELRDANGDKVEYPQVLLKVSRNEVAEGSLKPGEETQARLYFPLPDDVGAKAFTLAETLEDKPSYGLVFDLSNVKYP